jgi:uncharacterized protein (DUF58 family)
MVRAKQVSEPLELVVYPALAALPPAVLRALPAPRSEASREKGASRTGDLAGLRLFRHGDDPRDIHWRTSARRGVPFVREHEDDVGQEALVELDNHAGAGAQEFELAVSRAATLCVELARRGLSVGLVTRAAEIPPGAGPDHLARLLRLLAFVAPDAGPRALSRRRPLVRVRGDAQIELPGVQALRKAEHA